MRILLFILLFVSAPSFASTGIGGFFSEVLGFFEGVWLFFTETIPMVIGNFLVWVYSFVLYIQFNLMLDSLMFAHSVALSFLDLINISGVVNSAISALPSDLKQVAIDVRFFDSLTILVEALITRMVYQW